MPEIRKHFLSQSVGEALGLPDDAQCALVVQARAFLEADGYVPHQTGFSPQGWRELELLYVKMHDSENGAIEAMAGIRYNIAAAAPEDRAQITLTEVTGPERRIVTRTVSLAAYVREKTGSQDADRKNDAQQDTKSQNDAAGHDAPSAPFTERKPSP